MISLQTNNDDDDVVGKVSFLIFVTQHIASHHKFMTINQRSRVIFLGQKSEREREKNQQLFKKLFL
jgi:hypothetical protein